MREGLDPLVDLIEVSVPEVFLVLEEDAHLPDEALEGNCAFFFAALEGGEEVAEKCEGKTGLHGLVPVLLCGEVAIGELGCECFDGDVLELREGVELFGVQRCDAWINAVL